MNKIHSILILTGATIILAACGNRGALQPAKGEALPPAIYGEAKAPSGCSTRKTSPVKNC